MNDYDLGWLSALIDGEGSIGMRKNHSAVHRRGFSWRPLLEIGNTDVNLLEAATSIVGGGTIRRHKPKSERCRPYYMVVIGANLLRQVLPEIHLITKEQHRLLLLEALDLLAEHSSWGRTPHDIRLEEIYKELRRLNRRGPR